MGTIVAVLNQKGGGGKTTVTRGLASAAWAADVPVLVADLDPATSATWALGVDPEDVEAPDPHKAIVYETGWGEPAGLLVVDASDEGRNPGQRLRRAIETADRDALVLLDCPPSLSGPTAVALAAADLALVVAEPAALSLRGLAAVIDAIDDVWAVSNPDLDLAGVVLNRVPAVSAEAERRMDDLATQVGRRAVWQPPIPQRVVVTQAVNERQPVHAYGARAQDVSEAFDRHFAHLRRAARRRG